MKSATIENGINRAYLLEILVLNKQICKAGVAQVRIFNLPSSPSHLRRINTLEKAVNWLLLVNYTTPHGGSYVLQKHQKDNLWYC